MTEGQRGVLFEAIDNQPALLAEWIAQAPAGASSYDVIGFTLRQWHRLRADLAAQADQAEADDAARAVADQAAREADRRREEYIRRRSFEELMAAAGSVFASPVDGGGVLNLPSGPDQGPPGSRVSALPELQPKSPAPVT